MTITMATPTLKTATPIKEHCIECNMWVFATDFNYENDICNECSSIGVDMAYPVENTFKDKHDAISYALMKKRKHDTKQIAFLCGTTIERVEALIDAHNEKAWEGLEQDEVY